VEVVAPAMAVVVAMVVVAMVVVVAIVMVAIVTVLWNIGWNTRALGGIELQRGHILVLLAPEFAVVSFATFAAFTTFTAFTS